MTRGLELAGAHVGKNDTEWLETAPEAHISGAGDLVRNAWIPVLCSSDRVVLWVKAELWRSVSHLNLGFSSFDLSPIISPTLALKLFRVNVEGTYSVRNISVACSIMKAGTKYLTAPTDTVCVVRGPLEVADTDAEVTDD
jgi:hypothetical protein